MGLQSNIINWIIIQSICCGRKSDDFLYNHLLLYLGGSAVFRQLASQNSSDRRVAATSSFCRANRRNLESANSLR